MKNLIETIVFMLKEKYNVIDIIRIIIENKGNIRVEDTDYGHKAVRIIDEDEYDNIYMAELMYGHDVVENNYEEIMNTDKENLTDLYELSENNKDVM
jgi:hypothetical protein